MVFNNAVDAKQQGTQYLSTVGAWSGIDGGTAGNVLVSNGTGIAPSFQVVGASGAFTTINVQTFSVTGTYTPTANMKVCIIECVGGGGGGGGAAGNVGATYSVGGGGSSGEYATGVFSAASVGASQAVTIGTAGAGGSGVSGTNGGNTSVGALISAFGGIGGSTDQGASVNVQGVVGGTGGAGGNYRIPGNAGHQAQGSVAAGILIAGFGADSHFGAGGLSGIIPPSGTGSAALGFGSGGGGAEQDTGVNVNLSGGNGAAGFVVITEYI